MQAAAQNIAVESSGKHGIASDSKNNSTGETLALSKATGACKQVKR